MQWLDLAFLHWPVPPEVLRPLIPAGLTLDTFEGQAWVGVVPFRMAKVRVRLTPPVPTAYNFAELNVRTYVRRRDRAGVWFMSLDAPSRLAVLGARIGCNLPYYRAEMERARTGEVTSYRSRRTHRGAAPAEFEARYGPTGATALAAKGTLAHWLTERYCLFTAGWRGRVSQLDVHHRPWPLQPGMAEIKTNSMALASGIPLPDRPPLVHYSAGVDVVAWPPAAG
jgi:uncharacterized protein YqjF (DUF2071 family)